MATWIVKQGSAAVFAVTIKDDQGNTITTYDGSEALTAKVWPGRDQQVTFSPAVAWLDPTAGTVQFTISASQSTAAAPGLYYVSGTVTDDIGPLDFYFGQVEITGSPGALTAVPATYGSLQDLLDYAQWLEALQSNDPDQSETGFLRQRARARSWLDEIIVNRWKWNSYSPQIGQPGWGTWAFTYGRDPIPSKWLRDQLAANFLMVTDHVREIVAKRAIYLICEPQLGSTVGVPFQALAKYFAMESENLLKTYRAEIDLNADGFAEIVIPCGATDLR